MPCARCHPGLEDAMDGRLSAVCAETCSLLARFNTHSREKTMETDKLMMNFSYFVNSLCKCE